MIIAWLLKFPPFLRYQDRWSLCFLPAHNFLSSNHWKIDFSLAPVLHCNWHQMFLQYSSQMNLWQYLASYSVCVRSAVTNTFGTNFQWVIIQLSTMQSLQKYCHRWIPGNANFRLHFSCSFQNKVYLVITSPLNFQVYHFFSNYILYVVVYMWATLVFLSIHKGCTMRSTIIILNSLSLFL